MNIEKFATISIKDEEIKVTPDSCYYETPKIKIDAETSMSNDKAIIDFLLSRQILQKLLDNEKDDIFSFNIKIDYSEIEKFLSLKKR